MSAAVSATWAIEVEQRGSAQWMSSKTTTSGRRRASCSNSLRSAPEHLLDGELAVGQADHEPRRASTASASRALRRSRAELRPRGRRRVLLGDPGRQPDDLDQRPERDALAVRQAAPAQDRGLAADEPEELLDQPRLADAGRARAP